MDKQKKPWKYEDIVDLPHPEHKNRPKMSAVNRAAQFSPFAALTGFGAMISESARTAARQSDQSVPPDEERS